MISVRGGLLLSGEAVAVADTPSGLGPPPETASQPHLRKQADDAPPRGRHHVRPSPATVRRGLHTAACPARPTRRRSAPAAECTSAGRCPLRPGARAATGRWSGCSGPPTRGWPRRRGGPWSASPSSAGAGWAARSATACRWPPSSQRRRPCSVTSWSQPRRETPSPRQARPRSSGGGRFRAGSGRPAGVPQTPAAACQPVA